MSRLLLISLASLFSYPAVQAEEVRDLYKAQAVVTGKEEPERTRGFRLGLVDVAVKLTGDARLADGEKLKPLLEHPHPLVAQFEYEDRMKGIPVHDEQGTRERPHYLHQQFNAAELDKALESLGLRKWGSDRPLLALWLGIKTAAGSFVMTKTGGEAYAQRIVATETSERRGIPILLPDESTGKPEVGFDDIAANRLDKIKSASAKADSWLCGVLSLTESGYWDITWRLYWQGKSRVWSQHNVTFDAAIKDGLQTSALIFSGNAPM